VKATRRRAIAIPAATFYGGLTETYNVASDPAEERDNPSALASDTCALAEALEQKAVDLRSRAGVVVKGPSLDPATREKLRSLGYRF
jgi:hypothetical protein